MRSHLVKDSHLTKWPNLALTVAWLSPQPHPPGPFNLSYLFIHPSIHLSLIRVRGCQVIRVHKPLAKQPLDHLMKSKEETKEKSQAELQQTRSGKVCFLLLNKTSHSWHLHSFIYLKRTTFFVLLTVFAAATIDSGYKKNKKKKQRWFSTPPPTSLKSKSKLYAHPVSQAGAVWLTGPPPPIFEANQCQALKVNVSARMHAVMRVFRLPHSS